ncbi:NADP-dependent oxidoreductase [Streptomyces sp. NPDC086796]|uniref:NADP-dependent oxidoreductase n=1 Tax=unclassified Streptomyces TaxID=2593676 RepID=UPI0037F2F9D2
MRAIRQEEFGGPEVLREVTVPRPVPDVGEIRIAVRAAGVNPTDCRHRAGGLFLKRLPLTLGWDVSGVVESVGLGVTLFRPGDEVFGMLPYPYGAGSHAQYAVGPARSFARKPAGLGHVQAAALPLASLTAYQALVDTADLRPGQRALIHAASGGVGHIAVQIAKARGAHVIGTVLGTDRPGLVRRLGADEAIDNATTDFAETARDIDFVLDTLSGDIRSRSLSVLRPGGTMVTTVPSPAADEAEREAGQGGRVRTIAVQADHAGIKAIADLAASGALRPHIEATFPLAKATEAHTLLENGQTAGKIVLVVEHRNTDRPHRRGCSLP